MLNQKRAQRLIRAPQARFLTGTKDGGRRTEKHRRRSSQKAHAPHENETHFPCKSNHHKCKWKSSGDIECDDGRLRTFRWQKCRKEDARAYIRQLRAPRDGEGAQGGEEEEEEEEDAEQPTQTQQEAQPQETQEEAAGPSSAAGAAQPMEQQGAGPHGGDTVPGPFGRPIPAPGVPPPPRGQAMQYAPGPQYMGGTPGAQGTGYPQDAPFAGGYGGDPAFAGGYGEYQDMPFQGELGEGEGMPMAGGPAGRGGGSRAPSTVGAPAEARPAWVPVRPENLYHSEETDGVVKYRSYSALPPVWGQTNYAKF